jgi:hypothetical protein
MIHQVLPIIIEDLNAHLVRRIPMGNLTRVVELKSIMNQRGELNDLQENSVLSSIVNLQEEELKPSFVRNKGLNQNPPIFLNITILFAAYFSNYITALQYLSGVIGFFQSKPVFTPENTPALSGVVEKTSTKIVNLDSRELSSLWSMLGAKYMPSVLYRFKIIAIDEEMIIGEEGIITEINSRTK